jgi:hypothetical protein
MTYLTDCKNFNLQPSIRIGEMVACGQVGGASIVHKMGYNASISSTTEEDIWTPGGDFAFMPAAAGLEITSDSTDDDFTGATGTGARTVKINYLTSAFVEKSETITLDGTGVVATVADDIFRLNSFRVASAGTGLKAAGNITIRELDNAPNFSYIAAGQTRARNMAYTVPAGKALLIKEIMIASAAASVDKSFLKFRLIGNLNEGVKQAVGLNFPLWEATVAGGGFQQVFDEPIYVPAGVDLRMRAVGNAASDAASATCEWRGCLVTV